MKRETMVAIALTLFGVIWVFSVLTGPESSNITNFQECADAGNAVGESYPRQCWTEDGRHFIEEVPDRPGGDEPVFCTADAKQCSDGSFVSRVAPSCEFLHCPEYGTVAFVIDGDTIELTNGKRVRYIGVDTPEKGECFFVEATEFNRMLVRGKRVKLERDFSDRDQYGRLLRYVSLVDGPTVIDVSQALVSQGYAEVIYITPDVSRFPSYSKDEDAASEAKLGLWGSCK